MVVRRKIDVIEAAVGYAWMTELGAGPGASPASEPSLKLSPIPPVLKLSSDPSPNPSPVLKLSPDPLPEPSTGQLLQTPVANHSARKGSSPDLTPREALLLTYDDVGINLGGNRVETPGFASWKDNNDPGPGSRVSFDSTRHSMSFLPFHFGLYHSSVPFLVAPPHFGAIRSSQDNKVSVATHGHNAW